MSKIKKFFRLCKQKYPNGSHIPFRCFHYDSNMFFTYIEVESDSTDIVAAGTNSVFVVPDIISRGASLVNVCIIN